MMARREWKCDCRSLHVSQVIVVLLLFISVTSASPLPDSDPIAQHLYEPEFLTSHRFVLGLEPVHVSADIRAGKSIIIDQQGDTGNKSTTNTTTTSLNDQQESTTTTTPHTTTLPETTDNIPETTDTTTTTISTTSVSHPSSSPVPDLTTMDIYDIIGPGTPIISKPPAGLFPGREGGSVDEFIITLPKLRCPQGYMPDQSGRCRAVFRRNTFSRDLSFNGDDDYDMFSSPSQHHHHHRHFSFLNV
ncbi:hypothetical protein Pmani_030982 [Petrolisthes manimaculis]|uniref:Uncharacterized protein n=1 Tax=Petrolisthes manimaculis TaxID=1843537 RepID=A0AAE1TSE6_9EUCA|nr:hypothetical protein Pmani_030982 [Petrolisthes manimaculis]